MPFTFFRSTVNVICPVICSVTTTVGPGEEAVFFAFLDAAKQCGLGESLLLEPRRDDSLGPILGKGVFINYNSAIVPVAFMNLINQLVVIQKNKVLADEMPARFVGNELAINKQAPPSILQVAAASAVATMKPAQCPTPVKQAMASANATLSFEQKSQLEVIINKYTNVFSSGPEDMGRTKIIFHKIDIGENEFVRQGLRRIPHEQISVLKAEVDKWHKIKAIKSSISTFASPTVLVTKRTEQCDYVLIIGG